MRNHGRKLPTKCSRCGEALGRFAMGLAEQRAQTALMRARALTVIFMIIGLSVILAIDFRTGALNGVLLFLGLVVSAIIFAVSRYQAVVGVTSAIRYCPFCGAQLGQSGGSDPNRIV